ncbi:MAG: ATP-dependent DNA helicase [Burkholderiales bacterium]|nr:ATP-dependent DNA helicase [Burkholderiales bacterium]
MNSDGPDLGRLFAADGPLASAIPSYRHRAQQVEMAEEILAAIRAEGVAVLEAGTGTGKTVAYLVPALLAGGKVIISTGTKTLQDQLFHRDIPAVRAALKAPVSVALLKGRANYVCHHHLERTLAAGRLPSREDARLLHLIARGHAATASGDRAEFAQVPESAAVWSHVTSTRENCLGQNCAHYKDCYVMAARRDAFEADLVVVNHHLFFADVMLKDEGMAELLPRCNTVIMDEAHQLPETARLFFGRTTTSGQLMDLARDVLAEAMGAAREAADWPSLTRALETAVRDARLALGEGQQRSAFLRLRSREALADALAGVEHRLGVLAAALAAQAERAEGIAAVWQRTLAVAEELRGWMEASDDPPQADPIATGEKKPAHAAGAENSSPAATPAGAAVRWVESFGPGFQLHVTPLSVAPLFRAQIEADRRAWVFTSATLAVKDDFSLYLGELGLDALAGARARVWPSPFNYEQQALLYVPADMPEALAPEFTERVVEVALPLIEAGGGGAFLLFTTLRAMRRAHELLAERMPRLGLDLPLLLQGEGSRSELLERFRKLGNAVLVASQSFWEGVDVRGEALKLVVIDKLPFAPPDDPVLAARIDAMRASGRNPFMEYQVPHAAIALKQGAGRLIRDETDRGVLVICDTRITDKPYGRRLWQALPPMRRTRDAGTAREFLAQPALALES